MEADEWSALAAKTLVVEHVGSYENLGNAWSAAHSYARYKKFKTRKVGFEIYRNDPEETSPGDLRPEVYVPLK